MIEIRESFLLYEYYVFVEMKSVVIEEKSLEEKFIYRKIKIILVVRILIKLRFIIVYEGEFVRFFCDIDGELVLIVIWLRGG